MKSLKQIREAKSGGKEAYQKFFNSLLKKYGVKSPSELDDKQKKKFYDEIDAGWESDDPNDKNERYEDPDNLNPETDVDSDEDQADKAASKDAGPLNAGKKMKLKAGYKMNAAYHKEDVNEAKKLKPGKGKAELDINWDGDRKDIKFATTKYKIKMKPHSDGAIISGDKAKLLAYLQGQDYAMDPEDIEDLYPELMESNYPKPLSIIRQNKVSDDALEEAYGMNEKMVMCEHCGKMHEEGACGDMNESEIHLDAKFDKFKKIKKSQYAAIKKKYSVTIDSDKTGSWAAGKPADLHKFAMAMGMSKDDIKKTYNHITPEYKGASNIKNKQREEVEEAVRQGKKIKGAKLGKAYPVLDLGTQRKVKAIAKKHSGDMERALKDIEKLKKGLGDNPDVMDILKKANESVNEAMSKGQMAHDKEFMHKKLKGNNDKSMKITTAKALKIKVDGNKLVMTPKQDKLMQKHKVTIRNDSDGDISVWGKGDDVHKFMAAMGQRVEANEGVDVDRRTKGFKDAMIRQEKAKKVREKYKKKKEAKKNQAELDARYDYDGEVDTVLAAANAVLAGNKLPEDAAANAVAHGGVDMAPNAGKKKKKELMAKRGY